MGRMVLGTDGCPRGTKYSVPPSILVKLLGWRKRFDAKVRVLYMDFLRTNSYDWALLYR